MDAKTLEKVLRGSSESLEGERQLLTAERWGDYLAEQVPAPPAANLPRYDAWRAALDAAVEIGCSLRLREAFVFPIWYASNESDEPITEWTRTAIVSFEDGSSELLRGGLLTDAVVMAEVHEARRGLLAESRAPAPDHALLYRNKHYVALESRQIERVIKITSIRRASSTSAPVRAVPPFSIDSEPALVLDALETAIADRVRRVTEALRLQPQPH